MPRFFCPTPLRAGESLSLPEAAARHVQVLRLQPGSPLTLFDGSGGQWQATVTQMGRREVQVRLDAHQAIEREAAQVVHLAVGMPANERMDWLVEKATELGAASITPLITERAVLRLAGERAAKKQAHWQAIAQAACEQCGRNRVPQVALPCLLGAWLAGLPAAAHEVRWLLSLAEHAMPPTMAAPGRPLLLLSGPEGGLSPAEEQQAREHGFKPTSLGPRTLRAETAPLAALAWYAR